MLILSLSIGYKKPIFFPICSVLTTSTWEMIPELVDMATFNRLNVTINWKPNGTDSVDLQETSSPPLVFPWTPAERMRLVGFKGIIPPLRKELLRLKRVSTGKRVVVNGKLTSGCVTVMASTSMSWNRHQHVICATVETQVKEKIGINVSVYQ